MVMSWEHFLSLFKAPQTHAGVDLYCELPEIVSQELSRQAAQRDVCCVGDVAWETHTLTGAQQMRLRQYRHNAERRRAVKAKRVSQCEGLGWVADLEQNESISRLSTWVPTILTHGCMWAEGPNISRPAMKHEFLSFQAFTSHK